MEDVWVDAITSVLDDLGVHLVGDWDALLAGWLARLAAQPVADQAGSARAFAAKQGEVSAALRRVDGA